MAGGTKQIVMIKKISGDTRALGRELTEKFGIPEDNLRLNPVTGHLELKVGFLSHGFLWWECRD
jgi:large subunit ribosomal protein L49